MKKQTKKQSKIKLKPGRNKGKKYEKPLSLYGADFDEVVEAVLNTKPEKVK
ncbi:MAG: hypothetical protein ACFFDN_04865 [Candidatus Hodarchaeota archaeon]